MGVVGQVIFAVLMVFCIAAVPTLAKEYTVGGVYGWGVKTNLYPWVQGKKFTVGDSLGKILLISIPVGKMEKIIDQNLQKKKNTKTE